MGNLYARDLLPAHDTAKRSLDLSRDVSWKEYVQHSDGSYSTQCLSELPAQLLDSLVLHDQLDASFNVLTALPDELPMHMPHLVCLRLSHNCLSWLPETIALFFHLQTLAIDHNRLSALPASLVRLTKLRSLDASHNQLSALPPNIGTMESLSRLNVAYNRLRALPLSLATSPSLTVLLVRGNALIAPAQDVCDACSDATLAALRKLHISGASKDGSWPLPARKRVDAPCEFIRLTASSHGSAAGSGSTEHRASLQARYADSVLFPPNRPKTPLIAPPGASALDACSLRDRIVGLFYGAAIAEAVALATEQMTADECRFYYGDHSEFVYSAIVRDEYRTQWKKGDWSTDFDQVMLALDSIIQWSGVVDELDFASRLSDWNARGFPELGDTEGITFSNTIAKVCAHPQFLTDPHAAARLVIGDRAHKSDRSDGTELDDDDVLDKYADDAALARSVVLGIPSFHDVHEVTGNSARICRSTHWDDRCVAAASFLSSCVAFLLQGVPADTADDVCQLLARAAGCAAEKYLSESERPIFLESCNGKVYPVDKPGCQHFVLRTLACAMNAVLERQDFRSAVTSIVMAGGHCKTAACVAGALLGCRGGYSQLPARWVNELLAAQTEWLNAKLNLLLDIMGIP